MHGPSNGWLAELPAMDEMSDAGIGAAV